MRKFAGRPNLAEMTLAQIAQAVAERKLPPVEKWDPQTIGESDMRIAADGTWYHEGGVIHRSSRLEKKSAMRAGASRKSMAFRVGGVSTTIRSYRPPSTS